MHILEIPGLKQEPHTVYCQSVGNSTGLCRLLIVLPPKRSSSEITGLVLRVDVVEVNFLSLVLSLYLQMKVIVFKNVLLFCAYLKSPVFFTLMVLFSSPLAVFSIQRVQAIKMTSKLAKKFTFGEIDG